MNEKERVDIQKIEKYTRIGDDDDIVNIKNI